MIVFNVVMTAVFPEDVVLATATQLVILSDTESEMEFETSQDCIKIISQ